jgi:hypothetical protein
VAAHVVCSGWFREVGVMWSGGVVDLVSRK